MYGGIGIVEGAGVDGKKAKKNAKWYMQMLPMVFYKMITNFVDDCALYL